MSNLISARYLLGNHPAKKQIALDLGLIDTDQLPSADAEAVVVLASTKTGISSEITNNWQSYRENYVPTVIAIVDLDNPEVDFEDMCTIVGKMLEPVVTPYLTLSADDASVIALIDLESLKISDYSSGRVEIRESDPEHKELVKEFAEELTDSLVEGGWDQFVQGLLVPAIPLVPEKNIGISEIKRFLNLVPCSS